MVKIPLYTYPNQSFQCRVPVNEENRNVRFNLWYNEQAEYWLLTLTDVDTEQTIFANLPLLSSAFYFSDILTQLEYLRIGMCFIVPTVNDRKSAPDKDDLGTGYIMIWGDNE